MKSKKPSKPSANSQLASTDLEQIEQLLQFMSEHNLEEFDYSHGDLRIRLKKPSPAVAVAMPRQLNTPEIIVPGAASAASASVPAAAPPPSAAESRTAEDLHLVKSPIVGTYYESPSPGAEPFVKVGGYVETGQTC